MSTDGPVGAWTAEAADALDEVADPGRAQALRGAWAERSADEALSVAVVGAYNSGKTSLIRRLLIEAGRTPPDDLTVSARPETATMQTVPCPPLLLVDTPGLESGAFEHDDRATEAALGADVLLVAVPPQLVTGEQARLTGLLERFRGGEAVRCVVGRCDTLGDAEDDEDTLQTLMATKRAALATTLTDMGFDVPASAVFPVAAVPDGVEVAVSAPGTPGDTRGWDGIGALRAELHDLVAHRPTLRRLASLRFWTAVLEREVAGLEADLVVVTAAAAAANNRADLVRLHEQRLAALDANAATDLRRRLDAELRSIALMVRATSVQEQRPEVERRISQELRRWYAEWDDKLDGLMKEAEADLTDGADGWDPSGHPDGLDALLVGLEPSGEPAVELPVEKIFNKIGGGIRKVAGDRVTKRLGMTVDVATKEVERASKLRADQWEAYRVTHGAFRDADHLREVSDVLGKAKVVMRVLPAITEAVGIIGGLVRKRVLDARERQRKAQVEAAITNGVDDLVAEMTDPDAGGGWARRVALARSTLRASCLDAAGRSALADRRATLTADRVRLVDLLARRPSADV